MKKLLLSLILISGGALSSFAAAPDNVLAALLQKVSSGCVTVDYSYTIRGDYEVTDSGVAILQGEKYYMTFSGTRLWDDGKSLWMADDGSKELYAEEIQPTDNFSNPIFLLTKLDSFGALEGPEPAFLLGSRYRVYSVKDLTGFPESYESVRILVKDGLWYPSIISLTLDNGTTIEFTLKSCKFDEKLLPESSFTVDPKDFKGYSFTDLREE